MAKNTSKAGLRRLEERETRIKALRAALIAGDLDAFIGRKRRRKQRKTRTAI